MEEARTVIRSGMPTSSWPARQWGEALTRQRIFSDALPEFLRGQANVLASIHAVDVLHRDLRPGDILLAPQRSAGRRLSLLLRDEQAFVDTTNATPRIRRRTRRAGERTHDTAPAKGQGEGQDRRRLSSHGPVTRGADRSVARPPQSAGPFSHALIVGRRRDRCGSARPRTRSPRGGPEIDWHHRLRRRPSCPSQLSPRRSTQILRTLGSDCSSRRFAN